MIPAINSPLYERVKATLLQFNMLPENGKILVGLSGGADSVCLFSLLCSLREEFNITLEAAHINHGIRGREAKRDEDFVVMLCKKKNVPLYVLHTDCTLEAAKTGESLEEAGRRIRYAYFDSLVTENDRIATAHNADDNAETVLFRLARGAGLKGVCGIPPVRGNIIRPLLYCSRAEIEGYCAENLLDFVTDSTNLSDDYARNKIRHIVIPALEGVHSNFVGSVLRFSDSAATDEQCLADLADKLLNRARCSDSGLNTDELKSEPKALVLRALKAYITEKSGICPDYEKLMASYELLFNGGRLQLSGTWFVHRGGSKLFVFDDAECESPAEITIRLPENSLKFGEYSISVTPYTNSSKKVHDIVLNNCFDYDTIHGDLVLRSRKAGDFFTFSNRKVSKSLKKLYNEAGISPEVRDCLPILADDDGVVWIHTFGVTERCKPTAKSQNVYLAEGERNERH